MTTKRTPSRRSPMAPEASWRRVTELLNDALDRPPEERSAFLEESCRDEALRDRVAALLAAEERRGSFMEQPIFSLRGGDDAGRRVGKYRLVKLLGRGGMGAVYLAERDDGMFEHRLAVKLLKPGMDSEEISRRFEVERQILARLAHPYVARLLDGGTSEDGRPYFSMEYVAGQPLNVYCARRRLSVREKIELFQKVCEAVHFAHQNLVVHRDLKPSNILVTSDGAPRLLDFGIAKLLDEDPRSMKTLPGNVTPLTPHYASPEQVLGEPITTASDVYSLGVLLYELLTEQRPLALDGTAPEKLRRAIRDQAPAAPSAVTTGRLSRELKGDLDTVLLRALHKEPGRRFASAEQLSEELRRYLTGLPVRSRPDTWTYRMGKLVRRHALGVATAAAFVLLIVGFALTMAVQWAQISRQNREILERNEEVVYERDRARTTLAFLIDFLRSPDPSRSRGDSLTVLDALDAAVARLEIEMHDRPLVRAELLDATGRVYMNLAAYDKAEPLLEEALELRRETLGDEHPAVAESLHNLASLRRHQGDREVAEKLIRQAVEIQWATFPEGHPELATGLNNLASFLLDRRQLDEAEALAREALAMQERLTTAERLDVAVTLNTLATILRRKGELETAVGHYRQSIAIRRQERGPINLGLAKTLNNLAGVLLDLGEAEAALELRKEDLVIRRKVYQDGDSRDLAVSWNNLAVAYASVGDHAEALSHVREALAITQRLPGDNAVRMAGFKKNEALALEVGGRYADCVAVAQEALRTMNEKNAKSLVAETRSILGGCQAGLGHFEDAVPNLLEAYETLRSEGDPTRRTRQARARLARAYEAWGKTAEADRYRDVAVPPSDALR